jgi:hypothetical protein
MQILLTRKRLAGTRPLYEYRLFVPFEMLSAERQGRIHYRTDFAKRGGPLARLTEVIAPMDYLRAEPSLTKFDVGRDICAVAKRIEAILIGAEMRAEIVPLLYEHREEFDDAMVMTDINDLADRYALLARTACQLTAADLGLAAHAHARAA